MRNITMCGYRCDLCKALASNIRKKDERQVLSEMWKKYYDLDIPAEQIYCDGCRCSEENARRIDDDCPVRKCVMEKQLDSCGECSGFPCGTFEERRGLSLQEASEKLGCKFCIEEYKDYLLAYDNMTRLKEHKQGK